MKIDTEIVCGFLGSGKSKFISALLNVEDFKDEVIGIIQLERGKSNIKYKNMKNIFVEEICDISYLDKTIIKMKNSLHVNRLIIEHNGTIDFNSLLEVFNKASINKVVKISSIYLICDCKQFEIYMKNIQQFTIPIIEKANLIMLNNFNRNEKHIIKKIKQINSSALIVKCDSVLMFEEAIRDADIVQNPYIKKLKLKLKKYFAF